MDAERPMTPLREPADPVTQRSLVADLRALGIQSGTTLLVHSSLSKLGWVAGGAQAVVLALLEILGPEGTLVMPAHTAQLSDPSRWSNPSVPEGWWPAIRAETPAFDPRLTPSQAMGAVAEAFRGHPEALRSAHPLTSFVAVGAHAADVTADHRLGSGFGEHSPLARIYELDGGVLLLGVGHDNNTSLHLAEDRAEFASKARHAEGAPMMTPQGRSWVTFEEVVWSNDDFVALGKDFAKTGAQGSGRVGDATALLMSQRKLVDFGVRWMEGNRSA